MRLRPHRLSRARLRKLRASSRQVWRHLVALAVGFCLVAAGGTLWAFGGPPSKPSVITTTRVVHGRRRTTTTVERNYVYATTVPRSALISLSLLGGGVLLISLIVLPGLRVRFETPLVTLDVYAKTAKAVLKRDPNADEATIEKAYEEATRNVERLQVAVPSLTTMTEAQKREVAQRAAEFATREPL
jgi:hypothetical protein